MVKSVEDTVAVQVAETRARPSVTDTVPRLPLMVLPGPPEPNLAVPGALMVSAPLVTVNVTVVSGSAALFPGRGGRTVPARARRGAAARAAEPCAPAEAAAGVSTPPRTAAAPRAAASDMRMKSP